MKRQIARALLVFALSLGGAAVAEGEAPIWSLSALKWMDLRPDGKAAGSVLWGDPRKGNYGLLVRFRSGFDRGWHKHSNAVHLIVIAGVLEMQRESSPPEQLGAGSGANEAAGAKYRLACKPSADCIFLLTGEKSFDSPDADPPP